MLYRNVLHPQKLLIRPIWVASVQPDAHQPTQNIDCYCFSTHCLPRVQANLLIPPILFEDWNSHLLNINITLHHSFTFLIKFHYLPLKLQLLEYAWQFLKFIRWCHGSPVHRYGLYALQWIVEVNGKLTPDLDAFVNVTKVYPQSSLPPLSLSLSLLICCLCVGAWMCLWLWCLKIWQCPLNPLTFPPFSFLSLWFKYLMLIATLKNYNDALKVNTLWCWMHGYPISREVPWAFNANVKNKNDLKKISVSFFFTDH